jgi:hypothetical protein
MEAKPSKGAALALLLALSLAPPARAQPTASVTVAWSSTVRQLKTVPAFQTVVNSLTTRVAPQHDAIFEAIARLNASYQRFVPWLPYPRLGVAELEPPSGANLCAFANGAADPAFPSQATLDCRGQGAIASVDFASFGTPSGYCGSLAIGAQCHATNSLATVRALCLGKPSCAVPNTVDAFGGVDPCPGVAKRLAIQATCSEPGKGFTSWDFAKPDESMVDFMVASGNGSRTAIPNFSTPPQWLYTTPRVLYPDDPLECFWSYEQGNTLVDPTAQAFGEYYGRLIAHYTEPTGSADEYGNAIPPAAGGPYKLTHWEILNEVEGEHSDSPEQYVRIYDATVQAIRRLAPIGSAGLKFVGLALISDSDFSYASYFLNASNHAPGIPLDVMSYHYYAQPKSRDGGDHGELYEEMFLGSTLDFFADSAKFIAIRDALSPGTLLDADELGVILPDDNNAKFTSDAPGFPLLYWNAAAALYAFEYGSLAVLGLDVVGMSQLVGYPSLNITRLDNGKVDLLEPQYPSVAMLNWTDGSGTARYWALKLIIDSLAPFADNVIETSVTGAGVYAQAFASGDGSVRKLLVASKSSLPATLQLQAELVAGASFSVVDEATGFGPARVEAVPADGLLQLAPFAVGIVRAAV